MELCAPDNQRMATMPELFCGCLDYSPACRKRWAPGARVDVPAGTRPGAAEATLTHKPSSV